MHFSVITSGISLGGAGLRQQAAVARLSIHTLCWIMMTMAKQQLLHDQRGSPSQSPLVYCVTHWLIEKEIGKKSQSNIVEYLPFNTLNYKSVNYSDLARARLFFCQWEKDIKRIFVKYLIFLSVKTSTPTLVCGNNFASCILQSHSCWFCWFFCFFYTSSYFCRFEDSKNNLHATCSPWMDSRHTYSKAWEPRVAKCCNFKNNTWAGKKFSSQDLAWMKFQSLTLAVRQCSHSFARCSQICTSYVCLVAYTD